MLTSLCTICGCKVYNIDQHVADCEQRRKASLIRSTEQACDLLDSIAHRLVKRNYHIHQDIWSVLMTMELAVEELKKGDRPKDIGSMRCSNCGEDVHKTKMFDHPCEFLRRQGVAKRAFMLQRSLRRVVLRLESEGSEEWLIVSLKGMILSIEDLGRELIRHRNDAR